MNGIEFVRPGHGFKPSFKLTEKVEVNGDKEHGLFTFLKKSCPTTRDGHADKHQLFYSPMKNSDIRWNFEKFLIDHNGKPVMRYDASAEPLDNITDDLESVIRNIHLEK